MSSIPTLSMIGFGDFGKFAYRHLAPYFRIAVHDPFQNMEKLTRQFNIQSTTLEHAAKADIVIVGVPIQELDETFRRISPHVGAGQTVLDIASVKMHPEQMMRTHLPGTVHMIGTHPLFGPVSGESSIKGLSVSTVQINCPDRHYARVNRFLSEKLGLDIIPTSSEEHDRVMARQAITHLIGRAVAELNWDESPQETKSAKSLRSISDMVRGDSDQLFHGMIAYNPFVQKEFAKVMSQITELYAESLTVEISQPHPL